MTSAVKPMHEARDQVRAEAREVSASWWWFLTAGVLWTGLGMVVLSYRTASLAAVAALVGLTFLFGGIAQLVAAGRVHGWRWLSIVAGLLSVAAGITAFVWPGITLYVLSVLVSCYLIAFGIVHLVSALAGPKLPWWWTGLLLGIAELVLGVWAAQSWQRSLLTLVTLVGVWAVFQGVREIFAAFAIRDAGKQVERLAG